MQEPTHAFDLRGQSKALGVLAPGSQAEIAGIADVVPATSLSVYRIRFLPSLTWNSLYLYIFSVFIAENIKNIDNLSYLGNGNDDMLLCSVAVLPFSK